MGLGAAVRVSLFNFSLPEDRIARHPVRPRDRARMLHVAKDGLADNTVVDPRPGTTAAVEIAPNVAPGDAGVSISKLDARLGSIANPVLDRRTQGRTRP